MVKLDEFIFNGGKIEFEKNENKLEKSVLGRLVIQNESIILSSEQMTELLNLCQFSPSQKWKLIYRATRDGFGATDFHSKCDSYQNSFVIIKSTNGNVFGGYTQQSWSGINQYKADPNAFLFSFINQHNTKVTMKCTISSYAIYANKTYGLSFGCGDDLHICNNSNISNGSYSNLGKIYKHPNYANGSDEAKSFLAGSYNFLTTEIEVYTKE